MTRSTNSGGVTDAITVVVVEDDRGTREGLRLLIDGAPGFRCVGTFGAVEPALRAMASGAPHVVLLDINLPGISGTDGVRLIREEQPGTHVLMLTIYAEQSRVFEAICNGASGYLLKKTAPPQLLAAIRETREGGSPLSPEIARKVVSLVRQTARSAPTSATFTQQELRLLALLADGHSYQASGDAVGISINTVRNHVRSIYEKLHVHSKSAAVSKALRDGLLS